MFKGGVAGDHDNHRVRMLFLDPGQHVEARKAGHDQIQENDIIMLGFDAGQSLGAVFGQGHRVAPLLQDGAAGLANPRLVVDHQDVGCVVIDIAVICRCLHVHSSCRFGFRMVRITIQLSDGLRHASHVTLGQGQFEQKNSALRSV